MSWVCYRVAATLGVAALTAAWPAAGHAQTPERIRSVGVKPDNRFGGVELDLRLERMRRPGGVRAEVEMDAELAVGGRVVLCFRSSADGYVTIWSHDAGGNVPARIYPNEFAAETAAERAVPVTAGEETCLGDDDGFRLEVRRPLGEASVYLHYTRREDLQFDETAFPRIRATRAPDLRPYASSRLRYRVVD